ncbi:MAG: glycosyltransferase [Flavobacteriaceae bacterium]|nr:glycosyltransferase [Bacteroidota bacterium]MBX9888738.1 glycosyltransferase [Flavobacteriaceae bacterium]
MQTNNKRILFFSTIEEDWGGSEELWAASIPYLQLNNIEVILVKKRINRGHPKFVELHNWNVTLVDLEVKSEKIRILKRVILKLLRVINFSRIKIKNQSLETDFIKKIKSINADLVIVAQGINFDGLEYSYQLYTFKIPFAVISQKAVEFYWPHKYVRPIMKIAIKNALKLFFISQHNLKLTEEQFGMKIDNSQVLQNPIKTKGKLIPTPSLEAEIRLACIGRLFLIDKGQDILIRILSLDKWKSRPIRVSFIGTGIDEIALKELAILLGVKNISFEGHVNNIEDIWTTHHALILPSRSEGMSLAMLEAMAIGRTVIVTDAGGSSELITDGENGFIGQANFKSFDQTMERAWALREQWNDIGKKALILIESKYREVPGEVLGEEIIKLINTNS